MRTISVIVISCLLAACANPINTRTARRYADAGFVALDAGDWRLARSNFARSLLNAEVGGVAVRTKAVLHYEYGRASGVICDWEEAEKGLKKSLELDRSIDGPVHLPKIELGRMYFDRRDYATAESYFSELYPVFLELNVETADPLGYAVFLDEYATTLEQAHKNETAAPLRARSLELHKTFPGGKARADRTPYGTQCNAP